MINYRFFKANFSGQGPYWFRVFGYGLSIKTPNNTAYFSERYGFKKHYKIVFGWRVSLVKP